ncbi:hypothetical protein Bca4012_027505 [Brassica carinata]
MDAKSELVLAKEGFIENLPYPLIGLNGQDQQEEIFELIIAEIVGSRTGCYRIANILKLRREQAAIESRTN